MQTVAVTAGYIHAEPRREFYAKMDAANVDLKGFTDEFYYKICGGRLQPVLDTLDYLVKETDVWTEITTLLIPGKNDSDEEIEAECEWIRDESRPRRAAAFHRLPSRLEDDRHAAHTPPATLTRAREIARCAPGSTTSTPATCTTRAAARPTARRAASGHRARLVRHPRLHVVDKGVDSEGACGSCGTRIPGRFQKFGKPFGPRRIPVRLEQRA